LPASFFKRNDGALSPIFSMIASVVRYAYKPRAIQIKNKRVMLG
jgi:hypothetical protein